MNPEQRFDDPQTTHRKIVQALLANVWTAMPGYIVDFDAATCTATVQLGVQAIISSPDGTSQNAPITVLPDVPVVFPRGGGCALTFPVAAGDECLVVFGARSCGSWKQSGGAQVQSAPGRMHSLSDGFAIMGASSQAKPLASISTSATQLRSEDGSTVVELNPTGQLVNITAPGGVTITAPTVHITGNVNVDQTVTANTDVVGGGKSLKTHVHTGVQSGSSTSGPPQ